MKKLWLALMLLVSVFISTSAWAQQARPEIGPFVKVYRGSEGIKVWTMRIGSREEQESLVQIRGIDHDWNNVIHKAKLELKGDRTSYVIQVSGKKFVVMILEYSSGSVYLPSSSKELRVGYDESLSEEANPEHFLTAFLEQKIEKQKATAK